MDKKSFMNFDSIPELEFSENDLTSKLDNLSIEEIIELIRNSPPQVFSPPLKPNQTTSTEKISIRIPRYILEYFREQSKNKGVGYQTLINMQLNEVFR
jgi:predicted DNA binding CopG/RHH family protein